MTRVVGNFPGDNLDYVEGQRGGVHAWLDLKSQPATDELSENERMHSTLVLGSIHLS